MIDSLASMQETVSDHRVDEFYAWNDFKNDFRNLKRAALDLADSLDDLGADLSEGLDRFDADGLDSITESADRIDLSRYELRRQEWQ